MVWSTLMSSLEDERMMYTPAEGKKNDPMDSEQPLVQQTKKTVGQPGCHGLPRSILALFLGLGGWFYWRSPR